MNKNALAVAQRILDECWAAGVMAVTPMKLLKLVYIAHGYMLGRHGAPLLKETVQAWPYGPVVPSVYQAVRGFRCSPVTGVSCAPQEQFDQNEAAVISRVVKVYGKLDGITLAKCIRQPGSPWSVTWGRKRENAPMSNDVIEHFYRWLLTQPTHSIL
jgi:uncharacterized phage-associated protein